MGEGLSRYQQDEDPGTMWGCSTCTRDAHLGGGGEEDGRDSRGWGLPEEGAPTPS